MWAGSRAIVRARVSAELQGRGATPAFGCAMPTPIRSMLGQHLPRTHCCRSVKDAWRLAPMSHASRSYILVMRHPQALHSPARYLVSACRYSAATLSSLSAFFTSTMSFFSYAQNSRSAPVIGCHATTSALKSSTSAGARKRPPSRSNVTATASTMPKINDLSTLCFPFWLLGISDSTY